MASAPVFASALDLPFPGTDWLGVTPARAMASLCFVDLRLFCGADWAGVQRGIAFASLLVFGFSCPALDFQLLPFVDWRGILFAFGQSWCLLHGRKGPSFGWPGSVRAGCASAFCLRVGRRRHQRKRRCVLHQHSSLSLCSVCVTMASCAPGAAGFCLLSHAVAACGALEVFTALWLVWRCLPTLSALDFRMAFSRAQRSNLCLRPPASFVSEALHRAAMRVVDNDGEGECWWLAGQRWHRMSPENGRRRCADWAAAQGMDSVAAAFRRPGSEANPTDALQIQVAVNVLSDCCPCGLLVFDAGKESAFWFRPGLPCHILDLLAACHAHASHPAIRCMLFTSPQGGSKPGHFMDCVPDARLQRGLPRFRFEPGLGGEACLHLTCPLSGGMRRATQQEKLQNLLDMGIPQELASRALQRTIDLNAAAEWALDLMTTPNPHPRQRKRGAEEVVEVPDSPPSPRSLFAAPPTLHGLGPGAQISGAAAAAPRANPFQPSVLLRSSGFASALQAAGPVNLPPPPPSPSLLSLAASPVIPVALSTSPLHACPSSLSPCLLRRCTLATSLDQPLQAT